MPEVARPDAVVVRYAAAGPVDGPRLLFAHSLTADGVASMDWFAPLVSIGWRVAALDQRGHGTSSRLSSDSAFALSAFAADYLAVLDDLGWETAWFGGGSMGAAVVLAAAEAAPSRCLGLALLAPAFGAEENEAAGRFREVAAAFERGMDEGVAAWRERFGEEHVPQLLGLGAENLACMLRTVPSWRLTPAQLRLPDVPVRVVAWPDDPVHPWSLAAGLAESAADGRLVLTTWDLFGDLAKLLAS